MSDLSFFATQGAISRPGAHADLFDSLPADIGELCAVVQGVTLHPFWAERYGLTLTAERGVAPYHGKTSGPYSGTRSASAERSSAAGAEDGRELPRPHASAGVHAVQSRSLDPCALRIRDVLPARTLRGLLGYRILERIREALDTGRRTAPRFSARSIEHFIRSAGCAAGLLHRRRRDLWFRLHEPERCWNDHRHIADNSEA